MARFPYVETNADLAASVHSYDLDMTTPPSDAAYNDAVSILGYTNLWIAIRDDNGYLVAPSKFAGHKHINLVDYMHYRALAEGHSERLDGNETDRRIGALGGFEVLVQDRHSAAKAVRDFCNIHGKTAKKTARVRVFDNISIYDVEDVIDEREGDPQVMEILLAAIRAAHLPAKALNDLFQRARAA